MTLVNVIPDDELNVVLFNVALLLKEQFPIETAPDEKIKEFKLDPAKSHPLIFKLPPVNVGLFKDEPSLKLFVVNVNVPNDNPPLVLLDNKDPSDKKLF